MADEEKLANKKMGHKCCAAAKCNFRSDNRPDLSFHAFPKNDNLRKEWGVKMRRGLSKTLRISFVVQPILYHLTSNIV